MLESSSKGLKESGTAGKFFYFIKLQVYRKGFNSWSFRELANYVKTSVINALEINLTLQLDKRKNALKELKPYELVHFVAQKFAGDEKSYYLCTCFSWY